MKNWVVLEDRTLIKFAGGVKYRCDEEKMERIQRLKNTGRKQTHTCPLLFFQTGRGEKHSKPGREREELT